MLGALGQHHINTFDLALTFTKTLALVAASKFYLRRVKEADRARERNRLSSVALPNLVTFTY
jgi:hypothetical protein